MYDWLAAIARWLEIHVIGLPFYFAAPAMIIIGALDSSLLSLPEINDYLVVGRCFKDHTAVFYLPLFAATGSVIGCSLLYTIVRRGGQAVLRKRFNLQSIKRVEHAYERFGFLAIGIPAILPPPRPRAFDVVGRAGPPVRVRPCDVLVPGRACPRGEPPARGSSGLRQKLQPRIL